MTIKNLLRFAALLLAGACSNNDTSTIAQNSEADNSQIAKQVAPPFDSAITEEETTPALQSNTTESSSLSDYRSDSLDIFFKKQYKVEYYKIGKDTLEVVSGSDFLYYPFGRCSDTTCLKSSFPAFTFSSERDTTDEPIDLQRVTYKNSFVKLVPDAENKQLQIVAGRITNPGAVFSNGTAIGMPEERFMSFFIKNNSFIKGGIPQNYSTYLSSERHSSFLYF